MVEWLPRLIVAAVLLQTSVSKLIDPQPTLEVFTDWAGFPVLLGRMAFAALIVVELGLVVWLLGFRTHRAPAWVALGLMLFFTGVLVAQLATGWEGDCGCGGPKLGHAANYSLGLGRNLGCVALLFFDIRRLNTLLAPPVPAAAPFISEGTSS